MERWTRHVLPIAAVAGIWAIALWPVWAPHLIHAVHGAAHVSLSAGQLSQTTD